MNHNLSTLIYKIISKTRSIFEHPSRASISNSIINIRCIGTHWAHMFRFHFISFILYEEEKATDVIPFIGTGEVTNLSFANFYFFLLRFVDFYRNFSASYQLHTAHLECQTSIRRTMILFCEFVF